MVNNNSNKTGKKIPQDKNIKQAWLIVSNITSDFQKNAVSLWLMKYTQSSVSTLHP